MLNDDIIIDKIKNSKLKKFSDKFYHRIFTDEEIQYINNRYNDSESLKESIYRIINNIEYRPICPACGNKIKYNGKCFSTHCSRSCINKDINVRNKIKKTKLEKYGDENFTNREKCKETLLKRYGNEYTWNIDFIKEKTIKTNLQRYNTINGGGSIQAQTKIKKTKLEKYGDENFTNKEKTKETLLNKYGVENVSQLDSVKLKKKNTFLHNYGESCFFKTKECILRSHSQEAIHKRFETQRKNGTLNKSKDEDISYELLKEKFLNVERNYKCDRYPFACDFYVPSLDLFIECQYSMFHNRRPYLDTENDRNEVEIIKQKSENRKKITGKTKTRYDSLIETWTIRDVNKRNIAQQNNLNYLEFFTILELQNWLNNYE